MEQEGIRTIGDHFGVCNFAMKLNKISFRFKNCALVLGTGKRKHRPSYMTRFSFNSEHRIACTRDSIESIDQPSGEGRERCVLMFRRLCSFMLFISDYQVFFVSVFAFKLTHISRILNWFYWQQLFVCFFFSCSWFFPRTMPYCCFALRFALKIVRFILLFFDIVEPIGNDVTDLLDGQYHFF